MLRASSRRTALESAQPIKKRSDDVDGAETYYKATWLLKTLLKTMCSDLDLRELVT